MKNSPDDTATISAVDQRSAMREELDAGILTRGRRRVAVVATIEQFQKELQAIDDADEVAAAAMTMLEERMAGIRPKVGGEA